MPQKLQESLLHRSLLSDAFSSPFTTFLGTDCRLIRTVHRIRTCKSIDEPRGCLFQSCMFVPLGGGGNAAAPLPPI